MSERIFFSTGNGLYFSGTKEDFVDGISRMIQLNNLNNPEISSYEIYSYVNRLFDCLFEEHSHILLVRDFGIYYDEDEKIEIRYVTHPTEKERNPNCCYISWQEYEYYINLKSSTITLLALLLDLYFTNGIASTILALLGVNCRAIAHIPDFNGERCVLIEICRQRHRQGSKDIYDNIKGSYCVNNHLSCRYRSDGVCTITDSTIENLFDTLVEKNVLSKTEDIFKYNL